jgi:hypothetical protein
MSNVEQLTVKEYLEKKCEQIEGDRSGQLLNSANEVMGFLGQRPEYILIANEPLTWKTLDSVLMIIYTIKTRDPDSAALFAGSLSFILDELR